MSLLWTPRHLPYIFTLMLCRDDFVSATQTISFRHCQQCRHLAKSLILCQPVPAVQGAKAKKTKSQFENSQPPKAGQESSE